MDLNTHHNPTWCPGCGNFAIWNSLKLALNELKVAPYKTLICYGIGCSGNMCNTIDTYGWHSLHGRPVPTAIGAKLANHDLTVIVVAGDGDSMGEGMGHFIHAIRGNANVTYLIHDNKVYGLTTGQAAPTSEKGYVSKTTPEGIIEIPANPISLALSAGGSFVARGYAGKQEHLTTLVKNAITHPGFSVVDVLQPCVTFNKFNTYEYYNRRVTELPRKKSYNINSAFTLSRQWGAKIPIGVFYQDKRETYGQQLPQEKARPIVFQPIRKRKMAKLFKEFM